MKQPLFHMFNTEPYLCPYESQQLLLCLFKEGISADPAFRGLHESTGTGIAHTDLQFPTSGRFCQCGSAGK